jgi:hypothetical protein
LVLYPALVPAQWNVTADTAGNRLHLRIQRGTGTDDLLLRTGEGEMVAGHVRTDAYLCFVRQEEGKEVQAAMIDGTTVRLGERKLLALEQPGDAALW